MLSVMFFLGQQKESTSDVGELGLFCVTLSSAAVAGSLVSWQPCPVRCCLVEK